MSVEQYRQFITHEITEMSRLFDTPPGRDYRWRPFIKRCRDHLSEIGLDLPVSNESAADDLIARYFRPASEWVDYLKFWRSVNIRVTPVVFIEGDVELVAHISQVYQRGIFGERDEHYFANQWIQPGEWRPVNPPYDEYGT